MTIELAALAVVLALYALGFWVGYQEDKEHPPRTKLRF